MKRSRDGFGPLPVAGTVHVIRWLDRSPRKLPPLYLVARLDGGIVRLDWEEHPAIALRFPSRGAALWSLPAARAQQTPHQIRQRGGALAEIASRSVSLHRRAPSALPPPPLERALASGRSARSAWDRRGPRGAAP